MKSRTLTVLLGAGILGGIGVAGQAQENPYQDIINRNAFALKPPPPPPTEQPATPPPSSIDVLLTGISSLKGTKKVLLQIVDKGPGKKPDFPPPLVEGDVQGRVEVVSIDPDKGAVVVKIDGNEKTLTFEKDSPKAGGGAPPGVAPPPPGMNPAGTIPLPNVMSASGAAAAVNKATGGVMVGGGSSVPSPAAARTYSPAGTVNTGITPAMTGGAYNPAYTAGAGIPTRPVRTDSGGVYVGGAGTDTTGAAATTPQATTTPAMTREQAIAHIEEQRRLIKEATDLGLVPKNRFPPLPPTPLTPRTPVNIPPPSPGQ